MKILLFSDIHFHHTHRFSHITSDGFSVRELEHLSCADDIIRICEKESIDRIVFGGDLYQAVGDNLSSQTQAAVCEFIDKLRKIRPVDMIVGNHDICTTTLDVDKMIHKLIPFKYWDNVTVYDKPVVKGCFVFMPYCNSDEYAEAFLHSIKDKSNKIVVSHLELKDIPLGNGIFSKHGIGLDLLKSFKLVFQGHYHTVSSYAKNIKIIGSAQKFSFKDPGASRNNIIIYDTETNEIKRESFTAPDWLTFIDDNINDVLNADNNNYVKIDVSTDIFITDAIKEKLESFKGKDIHINVNRISVDKAISNDSVCNTSEIEILEKFICESNNSDEQKTDLLVEGKRLLDISR